jgi:two-component sensor histidine kinase
MKKAKAMEEVERLGFDIDAIEEIHADETDREKITGFSLPVKKDGTLTYNLIYSLDDKDADATIEFKDGKKVCVGVEKSLQANPRIIWEGQQELSSSDASLTFLIKEIVLIAMQESDMKRCTRILGEFIEKDRKKANMVVQALAELIIEKDKKDIEKFVDDLCLDIKITYLIGVKVYPEVMVTNRVESHKLSQLTPEELSTINIANLGSNVTHDFMGHCSLINESLQDMSENNLTYALRLVNEQRKGKKRKFEWKWAARDGHTGFLNPVKAKKSFKEKVRYFKEQLKFLYSMREKLIKVSPKNTDITNLLEIIELTVKNAEGFIRVVETGQKQEETIELLDLNELISSIVYALDRPVKRRTVEYKTDYASNLPAIRGNANALQRVFINLINNARESMYGKKKERELTIRTKLEGNYVVLEIADKGKGITKEDIPHIFDPYFTTRKDSGGTGLGLSICKKIVKDHGGTIEVESELGKRTTFTIRLPIAVREPGVTQAVEIIPLLQSHEQIVPLIEEWSEAHPGKRLLIFNLDSHSDKFSEDSANELDYNWATKVEREEMAWVIHFGSPYRSLEYKMRHNDWRLPERTSEILEEIKKLEGKYDEIWVAIDYDSFSTIALASYFTDAPIPAFIMTQDEVKVVLYELTNFLVTNGFEITTVVPAESRDYLGVSERVKDRWIEGITSQIKNIFGKTFEEIRDKVESIYGNPTLSAESEQIQAIRFKDEVKDIEKPTIIALGTDSLPGYDRGKFTKYFNLLNPFLTSIQGWCNNCDNRKNVAFVFGKDEELSGKVNGVKAGRAGFTDAKVLALTGEEIARELNSQKDTLAIGMDTKNITEENYIRLMEMLRALIELSKLSEEERIMEETINELNEDHPNLGAELIKGLIVFILPKEAPIDYDDLIDMYEPEQFA